MKEVLNLHGMHTYAELFQLLYSQSYCGPGSDLSVGTSPGYPPYCSRNKPKECVLAPRPIYFQVAG